MAVGRQSIALLGRRGQYDNGLRAGTGIGPNALDDLESIDLRHVDVEQHDLRRIVEVSTGVRARTKQVVERLLAITNHDDVILDVALAQGHQGQFFVVGIVFSQEDDGVAHACSPSHSVK